MGTKPSGPLCGERLGQDWVDGGTRCLARSSAPGSAGRQTSTAQTIPPVGIPSTSPVARMFQGWLRSWEDALARWTENCKGAEQERRTLEATGGLVAQAASPPRNRINPTVSDAPNVNGPQGLSPEAATRLEILRKKLATCAQAIKRIQNAIDLLRRAQQTGRWAGNEALEFKIFKERGKWLSPVVGSGSRGEDVEVLDEANGWWHIRTRTGIEGWVDHTIIAPHLPVELSGKAGGDGIGTAGRDEVEVGGARG